MKRREGVQGMPGHSLRTGDQLVMKDGMPGATLVVHLREASGASYFLAKTTDGVCYPVPYRHSINYLIRRK